MSRCREHPREPHRQKHSRHRAANVLLSFEMCSRASKQIVQNLTFHPRIRMHHISIPLAALANHGHQQPRKSISTTARSTSRDRLHPEPSSVRPHRNSCQRTSTFYFLSEQALARAAIDIANSNSANILSSQRLASVSLLLLSLRSFQRCCAFVIPFVSSGWPEARFDLLRMRPHSLPPLLLLVSTCR
jgi:hypothetical protein